MAYHITSIFTVPQHFISQYFLTSLKLVHSSLLPSKQIYLHYIFQMDRINELAKSKAAVIFVKSSDCMSHSIKTLFYDLGASPAVYEIDRDPRGRELELALQRLGCKPTVPAIFIGGKFVGSAKDVLAAHLTGSLKEMLLAAKAIWF